MRHRLIVVFAAVVCFAANIFAQVSFGSSPRSFNLPITWAVPTVKMQQVDIAAYLAEDELAGKDEPYRFGASIDVHYDMVNSGESIPVADGGRIWRLRISSPGAYSINLLYDKWYIPEGAELFLYNDDRSQIIGKFTSENNWVDGTNITQPVAGDAITLEYYEPSEVMGRGELSISNVVHAYRNVFGRPDRDVLDNYGDSGTCNNNVNCPEGLPWQAEKRGCAMILTAGGSRLCSGSLINNARNDLTPYFLTANHCLGGHSTWQFMFNYESPGCPNVNGPTNQTVSNSTLRASNSASDFALLQLSTQVPLNYNPYYNGWNTVDAAATNSVCIHHPSGDIKKITFDNNPPVSSTWSGTPANSHWRILVWDDGTTEPGSSGSPLFDQNHRITGQLHGGTASCSNNIDDYYGKFSMSWNYGTTPSTRLLDWLDPDNTGITVLDGIDPNGLGRVTGTVRNAEDSQPISGVEISVVGEPNTATTNASGVYWLVLGDGTFDLVFSKFGFATDTITGIVVVNGDTTSQDATLSPVPVVTVLSEDFEDGATDWTHSSAGGQWVDQWHVSTERAHGGTSSYKCGDTGTGTYANLNDARLLSPTITLPEAARLEFWQQIDAEISGAFPDSAYDGGVLEISLDGGAFQPLTPTPGYTKTFRYQSGGGNPATGPMPGRPCWSGTVSTWELISADLSAYASQSAQLRWRFGSDAGTGREGWYIDDVTVLGLGSAEPTVPLGLTIAADGVDIVLRWDDDGNLGYRVYSSADADFSSLTLEGETMDTFFTVVNGSSSERKFYYVTGWDLAE